MTLRSKVFLGFITAHLALIGLMVHKARASDLPLKAAPVAPYLVQTFSWTGVLFGLEAGYGVSNLSVAPLSVNNGGALVGGVVDLFYEIKGTNIVVGNELTFDRLFNSNTLEMGTDSWVGTGELVLGLGFGQWLFYGSGGVAYETIDIGPFNDKALGWTVGAGIDYAIPGLPIVLGMKYNHIDNTGSNFFAVAGSNTIDKIAARALVKF